MYTITGKDKWKHLSIYLVLHPINNVFSIPLHRFRKILIMGIQRAYITRQQREQIRELSVSKKTIYYSDVFPIDHFEVWSFMDFELSINYGTHCI